MEPHLQKLLPLLFKQRSDSELKHGESNGIFQPFLSRFDHNYTNSIRMIFVILTYTINSLGMHEARSFICLHINQVDKTLPGSQLSCRFSQPARFMESACSFCAVCLCLDAMQQLQEPSRLSIIQLLAAFWLLNSQYYSFCWCCV